VITGPKVERRGGYRPNAGRKPSKITSLSAYQTRRLLKKVKNRARLAGKDHNDVLLDIIHSPQERTIDRLTAIRHLNELLIPKISEGGEADKVLGPAVYLPEQRPVLSIVDSGKSA
jgi:hypothetical protein